MPLARRHPAGVEGYRGYSGKTRVDIGDEVERHITSTDAIRSPNEQ